MKKILGVLGTCALLLTATIILRICPTFAKESSKDSKAKSIEILIKYGEKDRTSREYEILASPTVLTKEGTLATIQVGDEKSTFGFKVEMTPTIGDNPELVILAIKAWETREVRDEGKFVKKWVELMDTTLRIKSGSESLTEIQDGAERDVLIAIIPTIKHK